MKGDRGGGGGGRFDGGGRGGDDGGRSRGNIPQRDGDWTCSGCTNKNFAWRKECNRYVQNIEIVCNEPSLSSNEVALFAG